jgi:hypothetical protein
VLEASLERLANATLAATPHGALKPPGPTTLEEMLSNPAAAFAAPEDVLAEPGLTREQKIQLLKLWQNDAAEGEVATEEGMPGNDEGLLRPILLALHRVTGETVSLRTDPTKQHALI